MHEHWRVSAPQRPAAVVFDLGGVLIDWNPRRLYCSLIEDETERERFLTEVCSPAWNLTADAGRPLFRMAPADRTRRAERPLA